jgi:hypothetical protein
MNEPYIRRGALLASFLVAAPVCAAQTGGAGQQPQTLSAQNLLPLEQRQKQFRITDGRGEGKRVTVRLAPASQAEAEWRLAAEGLNTLYLTRNQQGDLLITRIDIADQGQGIVYRDPMPLLPGAIAPNRTYSYQSPVQIIDLRSGKVTRSGQATQTIDYVRQASFQLPVGQMQGYLVNAEQTVDLDNADIHLNADMGLVPNQGVVYRQLQYQIDKPAWFGSTTQRTLELAER